MPCDAQYPQPGAASRLSRPMAQRFALAIFVDFYGLGINAERIFRAINGDSYILADFLCKAGRQLPVGIELAATDEVWQIIFALMFSR